VPASEHFCRDLSGLPPLLVQAGSIEILWSEIEALVDKAQQAGVTVTFQPNQGMFHTWQLFADKIPEGQEAIHAIGTYIKSH
jgi:epsilon-lactone hydrolase